MSELSSHEKYLQGIPLNSDLQKLSEGRDPQPTPASKPQKRSTETIDRPLNRRERLDLKEWKEMPGYEVFLRLAENTVRMHESHAISMSQNDPLANRDSIANAWAYVKVLRQAVSSLELVVENAVAELEKEGQA